MFRISKRFDFSASHQLSGLPDDHPCSRMHGHNYSIEVEICRTEGNLDEVGFVFDYRKLDVVKKWIDETLDHRHLNDALRFNPTSELLARWLYHEVNDLLGWEQYVHDKRAAHVSAVRVYETPKTCAEFRP